jgi:hypothetical protein
MSAKNECLMAGGKMGCGNGGFADGRQSEIHIQPPVSLISLISLMLL